MAAAAKTPRIGRASDELSAAVAINCPTLLEAEARCSSSVCLEPNNSTISASHRDDGQSTLPVSGDRKRELYAASRAVSGSRATLSQLSRTAAASNGLKSPYRVRICLVTFLKIQKDTVIHQSIVHERTHECMNRQAETKARKYPPVGLTAETDRWDLRKGSTDIAYNGQ
jgi:hypothetical protein